MLVNRKIDTTRKMFINDQTFGNHLMWLLIIDIRDHKVITEKLLRLHINFYEKIMSNHYVVVDTDYLQPISGRPNVSVTRT